MHKISYFNLNMIFSFDKDPGLELEFLPSFKVKRNILEGVEEWSMVCVPENELLFLIGKM